MTKALARVPSTIVVVCKECQEIGAPTAPRSCVECRVAMCEHVWNHHIGDLGISSCEFHTTVLTYGNKLEVT